VVIGLAADVEDGEAVSPRLENLDPSFVVDAAVADDPGEAATDRDAGRLCPEVDEFVEPFVAVSGVDQAAGHGQQRLAVGPDPSNVYPRFRHGTTNPCGEANTSPAWPTTRS